MQIFYGVLTFLNAGLIIVFLTLGMWWPSVFHSTVFAWMLWNFLGEIFPDNPSDKT